MEPKVTDSLRGYQIPYEELPNSKYIPTKSPKVVPYLRKKYGILREFLEVWKEAK